MLTESPRFAAAQGPAALPTCHPQEMASFPVPPSSKLGGQQPLPDSQTPSTTPPPEHASWKLGRPLICSQCKLGASSRQASLSCELSRLRAAILAHGWYPQPFLCRCPQVPRGAPGIRQCCPGGNKCQARQPLRPAFHPWSRGKQSHQVSARIRILILVFKTNPLLRGGRDGSTRGEGMSGVSREM